MLSSVLSGAVFSQGFMRGSACHKASTTLSKSPDVFPCLLENIIHRSARRSLPKYFCMLKHLKETQTSCTRLVAYTLKNV